MNAPTHCPFCGKELTAGTLGFGKNSRKLTLGLLDLVCCSECAKKYQQFVDKDRSRFYQKLRNMIYTDDLDYEISDYFTQEKVAELFKQYYEESKKYLLSQEYCGFFTGTGGQLELVQGFLMTEEASLVGAWAPEGLVLRASDMIKKENWQQVRRPAWPFMPQDISRFEYALDRFPYDFEEQFALSFTIKLNNPRVMTYKPCLIEGVIIYPKYLTEEGKTEFIHDLMCSLQAQLGVPYQPIARASAEELQDPSEHPAERITPVRTWEKIRKTFTAIWDRIVYGI